jgi:hypothetical protein
MLKRCVRPRPPPKKKKEKRKEHYRCTTQVYTRFMLLIGASRVPTGQARTGHTLPGFGRRQAWSHRGSRSPGTSCPDPACVRGISIRFRCSPGKAAASSRKTPRRGGVDGAKSREKSRQTRRRATTQQHKESKRMARWGLALPWGHRPGWTRQNCSHTRPSIRRPCGQGLSGLQGAVLSMAVKQGPNVLFCMTNRTSCILLVSVMARRGAPPAPFRRT